MLLPKVAKIAVEQASFHFDKLYDYTVPDNLGAVARGSRVMVPFGGGNRKRQGIVVAYDVAADVSKLKPVVSVLDPAPLLNDEMMDLALWLKERTMCTVFDAVRAMLPTGLYMRIRPLYGAVVPPPADPAGLTPEERRVYEYLAGRGKDVDRDRLLRDMGLIGDSDLPDRLTKKGFVRRTDSASRLVGDATVRMVRLTVGEEELAEAMALKSCTEKQKSVLRLLKDVGCASVKELCYFCSVTPVVVTALEKKKLVETYESEVLRSPHSGEGDRPEVVSAPLNADQQRAYDSLLDKVRASQPAGALLYGVTGSGKTQVYMNLIDQVIAGGKQVLVMVPEISLTPQTMDLFLRKYGSRVAVLHSALAIGERADEWKRIQRGEASIVVGTRSAVFAPCSRLGLIVMDEEQEHTYKSESSPRYHARDVARYRCARHGALLLLTSATPSVESYHAAMCGRYSLHEIPSRYGEAQLPEVEVVDMREQPMETGAISPRLQEEMRHCLAENLQVILLLNRRGYNTFVSCRSCGNVITCPSCSISMTYHRANGQLMCHYCGHMQPPATRCPACGSDKIRYSGLGTQRVEQEIEQMFPGEPVLRMDTDTTMSRFAYEEKFKRFAAGQYSIMIGTQMVAKGLDFPRVGLVGVLSADQSLYGDDFRCFETTFSLLTQVIGRAGRRDRVGKAVVQTYTPENYVIGLAARQDYPAFYRLEIQARRTMRYPPFTDLFLFGFTGLQEQAVKEGARRFLQMLHTAATREYAGVPLIALDPTPAAVARAAGKYRYKLLVKAVNNARMREMAAALVTAFSRRPENKAVAVFVDINPAGSL